MLYGEPYCPYWLKMLSMAYLLPFVPYVFRTSLLSKLTGFSRGGLRFH